MAAAKRALFNSRGLALIEASVSLLFAVTITSGLCVILYMTFARVWIERASYEAAICLATSAPESLCETRLKQQIANALPIGEIKKSRVRRSRRRAQVEVSFAMGDKDVIRHSDSRSLPLKDPQGRGP